jgi:ribosomal protein S18 acetylase RimI-like enzyme
MDPRHPRNRVLHSVAASQRLLGRHAPQGSVLEGPGYVAAIIPPLADAILVNGAIILDPRGMPEALRDLRTAYDRTGIRRWGVLTAPDAAASAALVGAGLRPEAHPTAMAALLVDVAEHGRGRDESVGPVDFATVGRINDQAYGHPDDRMEFLIEDLPPHAARAYRLDHLDEPASVALVCDHGSDAAVSFVATLPWAQRIGLATRLLRHALLEAVGRDLTTSTLVASSAGRRLYTSLGYRDVGSLELWQHSGR